CTVRAAAADRAPALRAPGAGERAPEGWAAAGGKACPLRERADARVLAVDIEEGRLGRVHGNLARLQLQADVLCADIGAPDDGWDGEQFDAILLDAPCSATGVIRRHPDIKLLRRREDIEQLAEVQARLLDTAWNLLKP